MIHTDISHAAFEVLYYQRKIYDGEGTEDDKKLLQSAKEKVMRLWRERG
jgi:hypothetical protein